MQKKRINYILARIYFFIFKFGLKINSRKIVLSVLSLSWKLSIRSKDIKFSDDFLRKLKNQFEKPQVVGSGYNNIYYYLNLFDNRTSEYFQIRFIRERYKYDTENIGKFGIIPIKQKI